ncbi:MAG: hypothetical protein NC489_28330 [Ruminococcus flavefaciens]|nr:hypothetical protein [Ruminococcus flavefaciens]
MKLKNYRLDFDLWGLLLFLLIMIPNFIWAAVPAPNDILRTDSITEMLDAAASVCQVLMIFILCVLRNAACKKIGISPFIITTVICCLLYFASWIVYYTGIVNAVVILGLTIPPCLSFLFFAIDRKNKIAIIPICIFTICHMIYGIVNFII